MDSTTEWGKAGTAQDEAQMALAAYQTATDAADRQAAMAAAADLLAAAARLLVRTESATELEAVGL